MKLIIIITIITFLTPTLNNAQSIPYDKQLHYAAGVTIATPAYLIALERTDNKVKASLISMGVVALIAGGKEGIDQIKYQGADFKDFLASMAGWATVSLVFNITIKSKKNRKYKWLSR